MSHLRLFLGLENCILYRITLVLVLALAPFVTFVKSYAEKTVDIYSADVLVLNQSPEIRRQAAAQALQTVLIRLSGNSDVAQSPQIQSSLTSAVDYLDRYSYRSTTQTLTIAGASQQASLLVMRFSSTAVKQLLKQAGQPIWSERRPDVLVWTATDRRGKKYVDIESSMAKVLNKAAEDRGLPIVLPVLDLEDRSALPVNRLWALDDERARQAAKRYATNALLTGRFTKSSREWSGSFILVHQGKNNYLTAKGKSEAGVAAAIIDQVSDYFSTIYAVSFAPASASPVNTGAQTEVDNSLIPTEQVASAVNIVRGPRDIFLQVNNIESFTQYIVLMNYLETLSLVDTVNIADAKRPQLVLDISLLVSKGQFLSALELENRLQRVAQSSLSSSAIVDAPIEFIWR